MLIVEFFPVHVYFCEIGIVFLFCICFFSPPVMWIFLHVTKCFLLRRAFLMSAKFSLMNIPSCHCFLDLLVGCSFSVTKVFCVWGGRGCASYYFLNLSSQLGIEPRPSAVKVWTTRDFSEQ